MVAEPDPDEARFVHMVTALRLSELTPIAIVYSVSGRY
jgi:hypothetical protein